MTLTAATAPPSDPNHLGADAALALVDLHEAEPMISLTAERLRQVASTSTSSTPLRESAFPILGAYDLASMMRLAGELWGDSQATGSQEDEADATTIAKTVKRVIERHPEIVQIGGGDSCGCGPVCCC